MNIACIGAGGHFKVILTIIKKLYPKSTVYILDDTKKNIKNVTYLGKIERLNYYIGMKFICTIGNLQTRHKIIAQNPNLNWMTLIHPSAIISTGVDIGEGTVIMAGCVIQTGTIIEKHCIINTKSSIDHDCIIGKNVHIAPGSTLCGNCIIGNNTLIGAGSTLIPGVAIGSNNIIGAGSVVLNKKEFCTDGYTAFGNPCKKCQD